MTTNSPIAEENPQLAAWLKKASDIAAAYPAAISATVPTAPTVPAMPATAICPAETMYMLATRDRLDARDATCELRDVVDGLQEDYLDDYAAHVDPTLMYSVSVGMQPQMQRTQITTQLATTQCTLRCTVVLDYSGELSAPQAGNFTAIKHHPEADFAHEPHDTYTALVIRSILDVWTNTAVRACL